ncbi:MAG: hypothetical protein ABIF82_12870 [Planctomycetota bacterium]
MRRGFSARPAYGWRELRRSGAAPAGASNVPPAPTAKLTWIGRELRVRRAVISWTKVPTRAPSLRRSNQG